MRTWVRAAIVFVCGGPCRELIPAGAPMLEIRLPGHSKEFRRCATCADEPVPADLAPKKDLVEEITW